MKTSILHNVGIFLLSILLISHFCACSEEEHSFTAQKDITDTYIDKLEGLIKDMSLSVPVVPSQHLRSGRRR